MSSLKIPVKPDDHIQGNMDAPITLIEYGDYECPYCGAAYLVVKQLQKTLGSDLVFVFRNFPLRESHPYAELAAETAEFAGDTGDYWKMHDLLYENQNRFSSELMVELTKQLGLSPQNLEEALTKGIYQKKIQEDFLGGIRSGVNGTPTFFINGQRYSGPSDYTDLLSECKRLL